ncbi:monovalent cation/H(+) antiporter subunit G [Pseudochelatococcus contaminans]|uniref:Multicomponent K+:H+ antiporter subunit G n=1 Tax=Pseudochelatococcus contaminans TaxID=1538103 RepID=A0A7W6EFT3_9HYPH|nr:multicomponent K+:H+ antiporter subunit G [Pseudochelatococcus contaminans]
MIDIDLALKDLPAWAAYLTAAMVFIGALLSLIGAIGLVRLKSFYERVHAPTLGATLGTGFILVASMICFTVLRGRLSVHEILIAVFLTITTPVAMMLLVRAALYRDRVENNREVPGAGKYKKAEAAVRSQAGESETADRT